MTCPCNKKKDACAGLNPRNVIEIINEEKPVLFHKVVRPASLGDDTVTPPTELNYKNVLLVYEANQHGYLYSSDGVPTLVAVDFTTLENTIKQLGDALIEETNERQQADAVLQTRLDAETEARQAEDEKLSQALQTEIEAREAGEQANAAAIEDVDTRVTLLGTDVEALENTEVQTNTTVSTDASTVTLTKTTGPLKGQQTPTDLPMPVASATQAGVMNSATYNAIQENTSNIDAIEGGAVALGDLPAAPTQEELTLQWKTATGRTELINRASIFDTANNKLWYYYTNDTTWHSIEGGSIVTVSQATNDSLGIVKGSTTDGQVAVEADGTMSLNGWDGVQHDIQNLAELTQGRDTPAVPALVVGGQNGEEWFNRRTGGIDKVAYDIRNTNSTTGVTSLYANSLVIPAATTTEAGVMSTTDKSKLNSLADIKTIGENLELTEDGVLNATGGGGSEIDWPTYVVAANNTGIFDKITSSNYINLRVQTFNPATGATGNKTVQLNNASASNNGWMSAADKSKLDSMLAIKSLNDSLSLDENGQLSVVGGGSSVNLLSAYTASPAEGDAYSAIYVNSRLDAGNVVLGGGTDITNNPAYGNIVIGSDAKNTNANASALIIGKYAKGAGSSTVIGYLSNVAGAWGVTVGGETSVGHAYSAAFGWHSTTKRPKEVSIGDPATTTVPTRFLANVTAGELDTDAVNLKQMKDYVAEHAGGAVELPLQLFGASGTSDHAAQWDHRNGVLNLSLPIWNTSTNSFPGTTIIEVPKATTALDGSMAAADKAKLDGLANIKAIGDNLTLANDGTLSATGSGGEYTLPQYVLSSNYIGNLCQVIKNATNNNISFEYSNLKTGRDSTVAVSLTPASYTNAGLLSASDKIKLDSITPLTEMEQTRVSNLPPAVVTGFEITDYNTNNVTLHLDTKDLATGGVAVQPLVLNAAIGQASGTTGSAGIMSATQATQLATLAEAYEAEEKGTTLYSGTASVNSITLSETANNFDHLTVVGEYMGMGSSAIKQSVSVNFYPTADAKSFQMNATDLTVGDTPMETTLQDIWMLSDDGLDLDLASAVKCEKGASTFTCTPETTSNFTIVKVVGFGKM